MTITAKCKCGKSFQIRDELAGRTGTCKGCGAKLSIPGKRKPTTAKQPVSTTGLRASSRKPLLIGVIAIAMLGGIAWMLSGNNGEPKTNPKTTISPETPPSSLPTENTNTKEPVVAEANEKPAETPKEPAPPKTYRVHGEMYLVKKDQSDVSIKNTELLMVPRDNKLEFQVSLVKTAISVRVLAKDAVNKVNARLKSKEWMDGSERINLATKTLPVLMANKRKADKALEDAVSKLGEMFKERLGENSYNTVSDRKGTFEFEKVKPGQYICNAAFKYINSVIYFNVPVDVTDGDVKLTLSNEDAIIVEP